MWICEHVYFLIREVVHDDGSDPCRNNGSDESEDRENIEKR